MNDNTYRVMKILMLDTVAEKLSYAGQTGKMSFSSLQVKQCVCGTYNLEELNAPTNTNAKYIFIFELYVLIQKQS